MTKFRIGILILIIFASGCSTLQKNYSQDDMFIMSAKLKKLSAAVESSVQYKEAPPELQDGDLLQFATAHNPSLLNGFENYTLKAKNINKHSIVLLCDAEAQYALIEDTGCTGKVDEQHWEKENLPACGFTIETESICN